MKSDHSSVESTSESASGDISSGKGSDDENFPVGSWLLPRHIRPHVTAFYAFARAADDIADSPALSSREKITRLDGFGAALTSQTYSNTIPPKKNPPKKNPPKKNPPENIPQVVAGLRESLAVTGVSPQHGCDLLAAFRQDARKNRYTDWEDLIGYCLLSAAPVGRYMLDLHGQDKALYPPIDALCNALQILNHLQDCGKDFHDLNRIYIPRLWMQEAQSDVRALSGQTTSPALRSVFNRMLDGVESLLQQANEGIDALTHRRLAAETAVVLKLAHRLTFRLRRQDPLENPVTLSKTDFITAMIAGPGRVVWRTVYGQVNPCSRMNPKQPDSGSTLSNQPDKRMRIQ